MWLIDEAYAYYRWWHMPLPPFTSLQWNTKDVNLTSKHVIESLFFFRHQATPRSQPFWSPHIVQHWAILSDKQEMLQPNPVATAQQNLWPLPTRTTTGRSHPIYSWVCTLLYINCIEKKIGRKQLRPNNIEDTLHKLLRVLSRMKIPIYITFATSHATRMCLLQLDEPSTSENNFLKQQKKKLSWSENNSGCTTYESNTVSKVTVADPLPASTNVSLNNETTEIVNNLELSNSSWNVLKAYDFKSDSCDGTINDSFER